MNKKVYQKPAMQVVKIQHQCNILAGSPGTHDEYSSGPSYSREARDWSDDEDE